MSYSCDGGGACSAENVMNKNKTIQRVRFLCTASLFAALYVALTYVAMAFGLHNGVIQIRFSEALVALAFVTPAAIPGLTVGCVLANLLTGCNIFDVFIGPVATLIGTLGAYYLGRRQGRVAKWICTIPNILANTVVVTLICYFCYTAPSAQTPSVIPFYAVTIFLGEVISSGILGTALLQSSYRLLKRFL